MKFLLTLTTLTFAASALAQTPALPEQGAAATFYRDKQTARKVSELMKKMTLEEKIGQCVLFASRGMVTGPRSSEKMDDYIKSGACGNVFGIKTAAETRRIQQMAVENTRLKIPVLFGMDVIHGYKTIFPVNIGVSASWDIAAIERMARISALEASAAGIAWTYSPMCDISRDPRWGRVSEGSGEDPCLGQHIAAAMVRGYQGEDLDDPTTILACVKHFAAYGAPQAGRDYHTVDMSERTFREVYLPPYRAALDAGAATVMTSFNDYDAIPATGSRYLMTDLLRKELGFNGFVVTDYSSINEMVNHGVAEDLKDAVRLAVRAGVNMDMVGNGYLKYMKELVEEGKISVREIDDLCAQVLAMKFRLGLFDDPYRYCDRDESAWYTPEALAASRSLAAASMVLLQNRNDALPIREGQKIALIGPFADNVREMLGSWVVAADIKVGTTFSKGLKERFGDRNVRVVAGDVMTDYQDARRAAEQSDVAVVALGLSQTWSGEAASLTSISLPETQKLLLRRVGESGKPVVLVLVTARPLELCEESGIADAVLVAWQPGTMAGEALADVLSGDVNPSGKLTMTFPRDVGQIPIFYSQKNTGRPVGALTSQSNEKYTSRYLFTPNEPLYPFGYGLSYTSFEYSDLKVENPRAKIGENVTVSVTLRNSGDRDGSEVAQLYIRDLVGSVTRPVRELKGFEKVFLKAGESRRLTFVLTPRELSFWRADMTFGQEAGDYRVWAGGDSDAELSGTFTITK
ncbi:glycoside hydrolase family 3 N-terminal domain-containing protein [Alistipes sp.]|uniref:glycoside hydrolase family 3 N-terminal domain-containing protein n=1 Tax=Alistipes sp. TaxID=1872444 RepID=UPI003AB90AE9